MTSITPSMGFGSTQSSNTDWYKFLPTTKTNHKLTTEEKTKFTRKQSTCHSIHRKNEDTIMSYGRMEPERVECVDPGAFDVCGKQAYLANTDYSSGLLVTSLRPSVNLKLEIIKPLFVLCRIPSCCHLRRCPRLKPSYEFHFEGLSNFSSSVEGLVQIQDVNPRI